MLQSIERVNLNDSLEKHEVDNFLKSLDLQLDSDVDFTIVIRDENGEIVSTASLNRNLMKCIGVKEELRGENITSKLIDYLIDYLFQKGIYHYFIYTKPKNINIFKFCGFSKISETQDVALLEGGITNINKVLSDMRMKYCLTKEKKAALVMNCNPFTLGHLHLIEKAALENKEVIVFVVQEDKSIFPFKNRIELVKKGVSHLKNVVVLQGGEYIISQNTFPSYFLKEESKLIKGFSELDSKVFGEHIAREFSIIKRYVGTEPLCEFTNVYNTALKKILPSFNIEVLEIERKKYNGEAISASRVRSLMKNEKFLEIKEIVPQSTYDFIISNEGKLIIEKLKKSI